MKSNILVIIGLLILFGVITTAVGIWHLSASSEFSRKNSAATADSSPKP
jgi:hypothetical protein